MGLILKSDDKGPVTVFRKDRQGRNGMFATYSIGISSKDTEGNWVNGYADVVFKKGTELNNKSKINIKNAFPVVSEYNGNKYVKWFVTDFVVTDEGQPSGVTGEEGFMNVPNDDDLPFAAPTRN